MTMLSDVEIRAALDTGHLRIDGLDPAGTAIQPASVDLRLDRTFLRLREPLWRSDVLDPAEDPSRLFNRVTLDPDGSRAFELAPHGFALAQTFERIALPNDLVARVEGVSSIGRLGLVVHTTAGFVHPGWALAPITLELANVTALPVRLYPGQKIAQLALHRLGRHSLRPYGSTGLSSHYVGQHGPTPSRSWKNFRRGLPQEAPA